VNRSRKIAARARGDGQARSLTNLQITLCHLDPGYHVIRHDLTRGETGLLRVFSLVPNTAGKPRFDARVDDGNPWKRRPPDLDIDIKGVSRAIEGDFKSNRNGYIGHHTDRSPNANQRIFDVEIATPGGTVFLGDVSFNVTFGVEIVERMALTDTLDAVVIRPSRFTRMRNALSAMWARIAEL
jgi:hypothetical protein